jgi:hypothetical protein
MRGEGIFSLARGFAAAGIPATVTNLWEIDEAATYQITELFYKHLNGGMAGDEALQQAKLDFIRNNGREHMLPYFWAASIYMGKTAVIEKKATVNATGRGWLYILGGLVLLLLGVGVSLFLRRTGV